jgi:hypothetical protein
LNWCKSWHLRKGKVSFSFLQLNMWGVFGFEICKHINILYHSNCSPYCVNYLGFTSIEPHCWFQKFMKENYNHIGLQYNTYENIIHFPPFLLSITLLHCFNLPWVQTCN